MRSPRFSIFVGVLLAIAPNTTTFYHLLVATLLPNHLVLASGGLNIFKLHTDVYALATSISLLVSVLDKCIGRSLYMFIDTRWLDG